MKTLHLLVLSTLHWGARLAHKNVLWCKSKWLFDLRNCDSTSNEQNVVLLKLRKLWWLRKSDSLDCNGVIKFSILLSAVEVFGRYYGGHYLPQIFNETRDRLISSSWEHRESKGFANKAPAGTKQQKEEILNIAADRRIM